MMLDWVNAHESAIRMVESSAMAMRERLRAESVRRKLKRK